MSIATAILAELYTKTAVTNLIGRRIYPEYTYQADKDYPLAVYKVENVTPLLANDGPTGFETADFVIQAIGETYAAADSVTQALQLALHGSAGAWSGYSVQGMFLREDGISDDVLTEPETENILYYVRELTFNVSYSTV